jgi:two-component system OmpR family sensor kinase
MPPLSLRVRLTLVYVVGVTVALVTVFIALQQALRARLMGALDQELTRSTATVRVLALDAGLDDPAEIGQRLNAISPAELAVAPLVVAVRTPDGVTVAAPAELGRLLTPQPEGTHTVTEDGVTLRVHTESLPGGGSVQAAETLSGVDSTLAELRLVMAVTGGATLPLVALLAYLLAGRGLRPLDEVSAFAAALRAGDLRRRLRPHRRPPEVQRLVDAFDVMLTRLDAAFTQQQRFAADVSHELRTPLTALRGGIDVLLMQPALAPDVRDQLQEMSQECARLIRLTQNLLSLARADTGRLVVAERLELDRICLEAVRQARGLREGVAVEVGDFAPATVLGDADLLLQMVLNLLENAVGYTPAGGRVTLSLTRAGDQAVVQVADTGPGIPAEDLPHVFERLYRGRDARRRRGGMGLGLALVRWIATTHGGEVGAANRPEGGAVFTVRLPLTDAQACAEPVDLPPEPSLAHRGVPGAGAG